MGCDKRMVAKASTLECPMSKAPVMETAVAWASSVKPTVPKGIRIGDGPDEEQQSHTVCLWFCSYMFSFQQ